MLGLPSVRDVKATRNQTCINGTFTPHDTTACSNNDVDEYSYQIQLLDQQHKLKHTIHQRTGMHNIYLLFHLVYLLMFTQDSLFNSNELISMKVLPFLQNTYK